MPEGISPLDIILSIPLLWGAVRGIRRGLILEVTGLVALFLGAYAALFGSDVAAGWLDAQFAIGKSYLGILAFAVTFITVAVGVPRGNRAGPPSPLVQHLDLVLDFCCCC